MNNTAVTRNTLRPLIALLLLKKHLFLSSTGEGYMQQDAVKYRRCAMKCNTQLPTQMGRKSAVFSCLHLMFVLLFLP